MMCVVVLTHEGLAARGELNDNTVALASQK